MIRRLFGNRREHQCSTNSAPTEEALQQLQALVRHALGPWASITPQWGPDGSLRRFTAIYDGQFVRQLVEDPDLRQRTEKLLTPADAAWVFAWDFDSRTVHGQVLAPSHPSGAQSAEPAAAGAPIMRDPGLICGVDEHTDPVIWPLDQVASAVIVDGIDATGTQALVRTLITAAARATMAVVITDFSPGTRYWQQHHRFAGFRDWPNVHLVADGPAQGLRAISYVHQILSSRMLTGEPGTPILLVINGFDQLDAILNGESHALSLDAVGCAAVRSKLAALRCMGRVGSVHLLVVTETVPESIDIHNLQFKIQVGYLAAATSERLWGDSLIGQTVASQIPGRALTCGVDGHFQFQSHHTPDPAERALTADERNLLAARRSTAARHPHMVIDLPADATQWAQIEAAPIVAAPLRPGTNDTPESQR